MRRLTLSCMAAVVISCALWTLASASLGVGGAGAARNGGKASFCAANDALDRASANVDSVAEFLTVLKAHTHAIEVMGRNAPSGDLGRVSRKLVNGFDAALTSGNANELNSLPDGVAIDTYCGVDGTGNRLPAYFGKGKGAPFCSGFLPIFEAVSKAPDDAAVLAALDANKSQLSQLTSQLGHLPGSIRSKAASTLEKAQTAIDASDASAIRGNGAGNAIAVALYCGQNS
ncbi:MAG: hypothetical protein ACRDVP_05060 [Acidimicrobiales bacterium]